MEKIKQSIMQNRFRVAVFIIIVLVLLDIAVLQYNRTETLEKLVSKNIPSLLNPMRAFVADKDAIVNFQPLRKYLMDTYANDTGISMYFEFLNTGANIDINKDAEFFPASVLKLPFAMAAIKNIEEGKWKWDTELSLLDADKDENSGSLYKEQAGVNFKIEYLINEMIKNSDNTAYHIILRNLVKISPQESVWKHLGLQEFFSTDGKISAKRYAVVLRSLYNATYLSKENSNMVLELLTQTPFTQYLEEGLPEGVKFAHKFGEISDDPVYMDSGIVYLVNRPYILIVLTDKKTEKEVKRIMKDISTKTFEYISEYNGTPE